MADKRASERLKVQFPSSLKVPGSRRSERRFSPRPSALGMAFYGLLFLGAFALGAGGYAEWTGASDAWPSALGSSLLLAGVVLVVGAVFFAMRSGRSALRVGDAGVGYERADGTVNRIAWCDIQELSWAPSGLVVRGAEQTLEISMRDFPEGAARCSSEAKRRIPEKATGLPESSRVESDAASAMDIEPLQIVGSRCRASGRVISFESDARICARCGAAYHKDSVPPACSSCNLDLTRDVESSPGSNAKAPSTLEPSVVEAEVPVSDEKPLEPRS